MKHQMNHHTNKICNCLILHIRSPFILSDSHSPLFFPLIHLLHLFLDLDITQPAVDRQEYVIWEDQVKACLIGSTAFLSLLLLLVTCLCLSQRVRYERLLKAAATTPGIYPRVRPGTGVSQTHRTHVPNTNIHADEGSNPIWMTGYDNEWYEKGDDEGISDRSTGNSLDENAVTEAGEGTSEEEPTTPTDSLNGSGRCSDSIKNDRAVLCRGIRQDNNSTAKMLTSRLPLSSLKVASSKNRQQLKSINNNHNSLRNHHHSHQLQQQHHQTGFTMNRSSGQSGKKVSQAPRPPISLPIPINSSSEILSGSTALTTLPSDHTFVPLNQHQRSEKQSLNPGRSSSNNTGSSAQINSLQHLQQQQLQQQQHNTLGRHSEVTCKNSINTIYISSNSTSNNAHIHSPSSSSPNHHLANNLSMISLETTEL